MKLHDIAHARTGDKGNTSDLTVFAYDPDNYLVLELLLTVERVKAHFGGRIKGEIVRYLLPNFHAIKFLLGDALAGGVTRSLALDAHGKCLSSVLLDLDLEAPTNGDAQPLSLNS